MRTKPKSADPHGHGAFCDSIIIMKIKGSGGRISLKAILLVGTVLTVAVVAYAYWGLAVTHPYPLPPLARGLPSGVVWKEANDVFDKRVRAEFPVGSPENEMLSELTSQGFKLATWFKADDGHKLAEFEGSQFPCALRWEITWRADSNGKLLDISGHYGEAGCL